MKITIMFSLSFLVLATSCANVPDINRITPVDLGDQSFFPTIVAQTDAPILGGNRVELLFNGDEIFPAMLQAIRGAHKSITYSQYLYKGGEIAYEFAQAFAERCRTGVEVKILLDSHGSADIPEEIPKLWREAGCRMEQFDAFGCSSLSRHGNCSTTITATTGAFWLSMDKLALPGDMRWPKPGPEMAELKAIGAIRMFE